MIPKQVLAAWQVRKPVAALTTVSKAGVPNTVWVASISLGAGPVIVIADNYLTKTKANALENPVGTLLFMTKENKSYQLKGRLSYHKSGQYFDHMYAVTEEKFPRHAALVLHVEEVYSGAEQLT
ncbi:MAG TPA: pyridoxamine 5'-phosphate oxidase family protein [Sphaerochaeta sp.]|nr:pyridoxamine 5'-phosphate oxidase family protein [Sphaerochaeta sp.]